MTTIRIEGDGFVVDEPELWDREYVYLEPELVPLELAFYGMDAQGNYQEMQPYPYANILNPQPNQSIQPDPNEGVRTLWVIFWTAMFTFTVMLGILWRL